MGYRKYNAFNFQYESSVLEALSIDADYFVPKHVSLQTKTSCEISFSSEYISTMADYETSLSASAKVSGGGFFGASFKANVEY